MLKVMNVNKNFGEKQVLKNVCFTLHKGEIAALLGENGAGKSTLLRIISGFLDASSGEVVVDTHDIHSDRLTALRKLGYVQEISSLYSELTVYEFLDFSADLRQINPAEKEERIKESVKLLDLADVITQRLDTLSKGFKKRVELAGVLLSQPQILLLDEPTEGLDPNQKHSIRQAIKDYAKDHTVIISTHTMEDVEATASRVLLLHKGELQADENLADFKKIAKNDLLESFRKITKN